MRRNFEVLKELKKKKIHQFPFKTTGNGSSYLFKFRKGNGTNNNNKYNLRKGGFNYWK